MLEPVLPEIKTFRFPLDAAKGHAQARGGCTALRKQNTYGYPGPERGREAVARATATGAGKARAARGGGPRRQRGAADPPGPADARAKAGAEVPAAAPIPALTPAAAVTPSPFSLRDQEVERALRMGEQSGLLEDLFGQPGLDELRRLAREAEAGQVRGAGDRVLILPGIMGSKLGYVGPLVFDDAVWADPADIALGRLSELRLNGGSSKIQALGVMLFAYLALKLRLRARGHAAEFFPFDWRLSLDELGRRLGAELGRDGRRTHLVCHSMGGLVARAMLGPGAAPANLGRLITVGTPHNGSYSPVQAFRGVHSIVRKVAVLDLLHDQADLADIFGTFPGLLQMIPSPRLRPLDLFDPAAWPAHGPKPGDRMLAAARTAQVALPSLDAVNLPAAGGLDGPRVVLIVGTGSETVVGVRRQATGTGGDEFVYDLSNDGDGTVPLDLAVVPGLRTYATSAGHGGMPNDSLVAQAVDNIIATGETAVLPRLDVATAAQRRAAPLRSVTDAELSAMGPRTGAVRGGLGVREQRELLAEVAAPPAPRGTLLPAAAGFAVPSGALPAGVAALPVGAAQGPGRVTDAAAGLSRGLVVGRRRQQRVEVTLAHGSITDADADAYVVGIFRSVAPAGAAAAVDAALAKHQGATGPLADLIARRMVSGGVGEITALPVNRSRRVRADAILLAGLGNIGEYTEGVLEAVGESIMRTALLSRLEEIAVVPIGASAGTASGVAVTYLVTGFLKALRSYDGGRLRGFTFCETDAERYGEIRDTFYQLLRTTLFDDVEVTLTEVDLPPPPVARRSAVPPLRGPEPVYLLVQQELDASGAANVVGTVLTAGGKASIIKLAQRLDAQRLQNLLAKVRDGSAAIGDVAQFGAELSKLVLHPDLLTLLARETAPPAGASRAGAPLVVVHDASMSRVPWEVLHLDGGAAPALLGGLSHRYNGGVLSVAKWMENRTQGAELSILLVVDPTENLEGARREGDRIQKLVNERLPRARLRGMRGPEARRSELLKCFASGEYDVVHYAGHAFFDPVDRARSGILCYGNEVLSGADLAALSRLPSLVVFNACESARVRRLLTDQDAVVTDKVQEPVRGTVGFAEAFLAGGIANYIGTYWPVGDDSASKFAETFYGALLAARPVGDALLAARRAVSELAAGAADWADYVFYGNPGFVLTAPAVSAAPPLAGGGAETPAAG